MASPLDRPAVGIGQVLERKYQVTRLIGEGAMGFVYAARALESGGLVAIKCLRPALSADKLAVERFRREIRATMQLSCMHIVKTLDVGVLADGSPFMVMEYLEGSNLAKVLEGTGPLAVSRAVEFTLQTCLALAHAHRFGIVHRDIKPENLFLAKSAAGQEQIKVLDFGISKLTLSSSNSLALNLTAKAARLGSPLYVSPEQKTVAHDADPRADIWSLGITLFEMIAGEVPFDASPLSIRDPNEPPSSVPSLTRYRSDVPIGLEQVLVRCLQRMPQRRYQTIGELAEALSAFAPNRALYLVKEATQELGMSPSALTPKLSAWSISQRQGALQSLMGRGSTLGPGASHDASGTPYLVRRIAIGLAITAVISSVGVWLVLRRAPSGPQPAQQSTAVAPPHASRALAAAAATEGPALTPNAPLPTASLNVAAPPPTNMKHESLRAPIPVARIATDPTTTVAEPAPEPASAEAPPTAASAPEPPTDVGY